MAWAGRPRSTMAVKTTTTTAVPATARTVRARGPRTADPRT